MKTFIGKTNSIAFVMRRAIPKLKLKDTPALDRTYCLYGKAGTGKTTLAMEVGLACCNGNALGVEQLNGQSMSVETVRRWQEAGHYYPMFGDCRVYVVDEIDAASPAALGQLRTMLDTMAPRTVFLATTNKTLTELPDALQSRFKGYAFEKVPAPEIAKFIQKEHGLDATTAAKIADGCNGNVRAAICDALAVAECS
jgi:replication-associated recombination protein RarA